MEKYLNKFPLKRLIIKVVTTKIRSTMWDNKMQEAIICIPFEKITDAALPVVFKKHKSNISTRNKCLEKFPKLLQNSYLFQKFGEKLFPVKRWIECRKVSFQHPFHSCLGWKQGYRNPWKFYSLCYFPEGSKWLGK